MLGIDKRALLCDYYPDELPALFEAWASLRGSAQAAQAERVDVMEFLSM